MPLGLDRPAGAVALFERRLRRSSGGATDPLRAADGARDRATEAARDRATDAARERATDAARDRPPIEERREPLEGDSSTIGCRTSRSSCALALCFFFSSGLSTSRGTARRRVALNSDDAEAGRWSTYPRGDVVECCTGPTPCTAMHAVSGATQRSSADTEASARTPRGRYTRRSDCARSWDWMYSRGFCSAHTATHTAVYAPHTHNRCKTFDGGTKHGRGAKHTRTRFSSRSSY